MGWLTSCFQQKTLSQSNSLFTHISKSSRTHPLFSTEPSISQIIHSYVFEDHAGLTYVQQKIIAQLKDPFITVQKSSRAHQLFLTENHVSAKSSVYKLFRIKQGSPAIFNRKSWLSQKIHLYAFPDQGDSHSVFNKKSWLKPKNHLYAVQDQGDSHSIFNRKSQLSQKTHLYVVRKQRRLTAYFQETIVDQPNLFLTRIRRDSQTNTNREALLS